MDASLEKLLKILNLEKMSDNIFVGESYSREFRRVFGGQVIAQALVAAQNTVQDWCAHSLHCYFMLPGNPDIPIEYKVKFLRDGKSFVTRQVAAYQKDREIFTLTASFQRIEDGLEYQADMVDVPRPDELPSEEELVHTAFEKVPEQIQSFMTRRRPIEMRFVDFSHYIEKSGRSNVQNIWLRSRGKISDAPQMHQALLAYASDYNLLATALIPHGKTLFDPNIMPASLDHSIWFHRSFRIDDWLLYQMDCPSTHNSRGLTRGTFYDLNGRLVASVAQEGLIRTIKSSK